MLDAIMTDTVGLVRAGGLDKFNEQLPSSVEYMAARVDWESRLVVDRSGEEVLSIANVKMREKPTHEDAIEINGEQHMILSIREKRVFSRVSHYEVRVR